MARDTRALVDELHNAYRDGDGERVAALIHDDIDWCIYGPDHVFTFEGARRGKAEVMEVLASIGRQFELRRYEPETVIVQGDRAAALIRTSFVQRSTGRTMSMHFATFMRFADGRVIEFKEFSDTFDVVQQALGASLHVPAIAV